MRFIRTRRRGFILAEGLFAVTILMLFLFLGVCLLGRLRASLDGSEYHFPTWLGLWVVFGNPISMIVLVCALGLILDRIHVGWWRIELQAARIGMAVWQWPKRSFMSIAKWLLPRVLIGSASLGIVFSVLVLFQGSMVKLLKLSMLQWNIAGAFSMALAVAITLLCARFSRNPAEPIPAKVLQGF